MLRVLSIVVLSGLAVSLCLIPGGCVAVEEPEREKVSPALLEAEENRLTGVFDEDWNVLGEDVLIEITPNFFNTVGTQMRPGHQLTDGKNEKKWLNITEGANFPMRFLVGGSKFGATESATLRMISGPPTFRVTVTSTGLPVMAIQGASGAGSAEATVRKLSRFVIDDGRVRNQ